MFYEVIQILFFAVFIYTLILLLRVMMSWFFTDLSNPIFRILFTLTEPYLKIFRKIKFLNYKSIDFSPIAAFIFLYLIQFILSVILKSPMHYPNSLLGNSIFFVYEVLWGVLSFFLIVLFSICLIRVVGLLVKASPFHPFWQALDNLLNVVVWKLIFWGGKKNMAYRNALILLCMECLVIFLCGQILLPLLLDMIFK